MDEDNNNEEVVSYTVEGFIRATRPDGYGYICLDGRKIAAFEEVLCDICNKRIVQTEDEPDKTVVHVIENMAICGSCLKRWYRGGG